MIPEFTHPDVLARGVAEGWAEPTDHPTKVTNWQERIDNALIPFEVVDGVPICPGPGPFPVDAGRNFMGWWGETPMTDAYVTVEVGGVLYLLLIVRSDGLGKAMPGGRIEDGETPAEAVIRELYEETGLKVDQITITLPPVLPPDPRRSRQAWPATVIHWIDLGHRDELPAVRPQPGEVKQVVWEPVSHLKREEIFVAHREILCGQPLR